MTLRPPRPHPFLAATAGTAAADADALVVGLATDGGVSFRPGAAHGPDGIRRFSESIESYSPRAGRDLVDLRVVDCGDHTKRPDTVLKAVDGVVEAAWTDDRRPLLCFLGGDHSVTPWAVQGVARRMELPMLVGLDAHLDLREDYPGDHACTYRRVAERGIPCVVVGPRSGARQEWEDAPSVLRHHSTALEIPDAVRAELERSSIYVTIDVDVLDASAAPGTGNPEPGGPSFERVLSFLESLEGLDVVAFDVVEVSPPLDPSGVTQASAAVLVREMILRFAGRRRR